MEVQASRPRPRISLLVPTHGRPDCVRALLARLQQQTVPDHVFELILVDDGGDPPVAIDVMQFGFACKVVRRWNGGPSAARNTGLALVSAPLVLILNDDAVPAPDLIERHLAAQEKSDGRTAILGTFHFSKPALESPFVQVLDQSNLLFAFKSLVHGQKYPWTYFWTCNISLSTDALFNVGGFDEVNFNRAICEDTELGYRLEQAGWSVQYDESCVAEHEHILTPEGFMQRAIQLGIYQTRMNVKHPAVGIGLPGLPPDRISRERELRKAITSRMAASRELIARLETLEQTHRGVVLPRSLVQDIDTAVGVQVMPYWMAGIYKEATGLDPAPLMEVPVPQPMMV